MAKAYDSARTRDFTPSCDKDAPASQKTTFKLGWLSIFDWAAIEEEFLKNAAAGGTFPKTIAIVRRALRGWTNFLMPDGSEAAFVREDGAVTLDCIRLIGHLEILEIAADCDQHERLSPEDAGKS